MKYLLKYFFIISIVHIIPFCQLLAGNNADKIISKLQKKYNSIDDATVTFTQHVRFGVTKTEQSFEGKLMMKKGNKYRIELEEQTIVTDGNSVWTFSKINNQVVIDKYKEDPKSFSPDKILVNIPSNYNATLLGNENIQTFETSIIKLLPKNQKINIKWIKVWIDEDEYLMRKIQILDISDNLTTYFVNEININTDLPDNIFKYDIPQDIDVIDLR